MEKTSTNTINNIEANVSDKNQNVSAAQNNVENTVNEKLDCQINEKEKPSIQQPQDTQTNLQINELNKENTECNTSKEKHKAQSKDFDKKCTLPLIPNTEKSPTESPFLCHIPDKNKIIKNKIDKIKLHELTLEALFQAYYDCRKRKRNTMQSLKFEFNLERNLFKLYQDLKEGTYEIGKSICFVVTTPKPREVWAGAFRDRIVHHLIYNCIKERFENRFIKDTFSCIPKRGTLAGALRARDFARRITRNYSEKAYFLKADISNYFNSINKTILVEILRRYVKEKWIMDLIEQIINHDPRTNVFIKSKKELWNILPAHKSLFNAKINKGLPIGNLTSQFFSNVYLNPLDQFVKHTLKIKYYCRYVDDAILIHRDPKYLNYCYDMIDDFLKRNLDLHLNPKKKNMNLVSRGFDFVGHVIKPNRMYLRTTIIKKTFRTIKDWEGEKNRFDDDELENFRNKINSYLGMLQHVNGYRLRKKICEKSTTLFTASDKDYKKIFLVKNKKFEDE